MDIYHIESNDEAKAYFQELADNHEDAIVEETNSMDGDEIIKLVIENLPKILTAVTALITVLKSKNIPFKITKNGEEVKSIE